ncbi:MAG: hypothetical protein HC780_18430 [Leptolyngbyaceae cyanobacterium CSU_1_3]|nr:hypothetical protein [Leptolyngbyaceae cyanobacterium CSU_1_3]
MAYPQSFLILDRPYHTLGLRLQCQDILRQPIDFGLEGVWGLHPQPGVPPLHPVQNL